MFAGLYRRSYRYVGITDLFAMGKAIALATAGGWIVLFAADPGRWPALSIVVLDAYLLATLLLSSRLSFRLLDHVFNTNRPGMRRVIIYGAGNGGVAALHEIRSNPAIGMRAVGFFDDDSSKRGRMLQGVPVYGPAELPALIEQGATDAIVIATLKLPREQLEKVAQLCADARIILRCFQITLEDAERMFPMPTKGKAAVDVVGPVPGLAAEYESRTVHGNGVRANWAWMKANRTLEIESSKSRS